MSPAKTLIVGGTYRRISDRIYLQKRSWEMLRLFSDALACPIFCMQSDADDNTLSWELPYKIELITLPQHKGYKKALSLVPDLSLTADLKTCIENCAAVYLREPLWECWDVYLYARRKGKPVFASYHGDWAEAIACTSGTLFRRLFNRFLTAWIEYTLRTIANNSKVVFFVGQRLSDKYARYAGTSCVFANYLHSRKDISDGREISAVPPYKLIYVGALAERKGIEFLIDAVGLLRGDGIDIQLTIVGSGVRKEALEHYCKKLCLSDVVTFHHYVQHGEELYRLYRDADIFVLPSVAAEGAPKVLMEAMTQGVPVICTDVGSSRQVVGDGQCGLVIPPRDSNAIKSAILRIIKDKALWTRLIKEGLNSALLCTKETQHTAIREKLIQIIPEITGTPYYLVPQSAGENNAETVSHVGYQLS